MRRLFGGYWLYGCRTTSPSISSARGMRKPNRWRRMRSIGASGAMSPLMARPRAWPRRRPVTWARSFNEALLADTHDCGPAGASSSSILSTSSGRVGVVNAGLVAGSGLTPWIYAGNGAATDAAKFRARAPRAERRRTPIRSVADAHADNPRTLGQKEIVMLGRLTAVRPPAARVSMARPV